MRKKPSSDEIGRGSGRVPEGFWETSRTHEGRRALIKLPKPKDPEGLLLKALLEDREQGR